MSAPRPTYEVYLDTDGLPLDLTSPVHTSDIMYYDTGIWIDREQDRLFVPYRRVQVIRELTGRSAAAVEEPETEAETVEAEETETEETEAEEAQAKETEAEETEPDGRATEPPTDPVE